jgi:hypothetical protein
MSFCQRAVIEYLVKEEIPAAEIHQRMGFYRRGIFKLPKCWEKRVQRSGDYVEK